MAAKLLLKYGLRKTIGLGFGTCVWSELWIPDTLARPPRGLHAEREFLLYVHTLIDFVTKSWKVDRLRKLFTPEDITLILGIRPSQSASRDGYSWPLAKSGNYTVKSGYWTARTLTRYAFDLPLQGPSTTVLRAQKAHNRKVFDNVVESPLDTLNHAISEEEAWRKAHLLDDTLTEPRAIITPPGQPLATAPICHCDGSWTETGTSSGHGWIVTQGDLVIYMGLKGSRLSLSPLHAELESLLWAMKCIKESSIHCSCFATDCSDLLAMTENPEDWPNFASELEDFKIFKESFSSFRIFHVPRRENVRADFLAKKARARGFSFSHVSSVAPDWLSLEENLVPNT
ncbi:uncharacterized protein LOC112086413 [Eutrema salsugineum]|uniref:uncharacterized protein LOC112086413 n=1 Tax=Eutrema salsugineum TaxID=72664 RepID=UPI000CED38DB|nr:uncharacterized protein LOC112086413 [Eutrema salsugineum]